MKILPINNNRPQKSNQTFKGSITLEPVFAQETNKLMARGTTTVKELEEKLMEKMFLTQQNFVNIRYFNETLKKLQLELSNTGNKCDVEDISESQIPKYLIKFGQELNDKAKELVEITNKCCTKFAKASFKE